MNDKMLSKAEAAEILKRAEICSECDPEGYQAITRLIIAYNEAMKMLERIDNARDAAQRASATSPRLRPATLYDIKHILDEVRARVEQWKGKVE